MRRRVWMAGLRKKLAWHKLQSSVVDSSASALPAVALTILQLSTYCCLAFRTSQCYLRQLSLALGTGGPVCSGRRAVRTSKTRSREVLTTWCTLARSQHPIVPELCVGRATSTRCTPQCLYMCGTIMVCRCICC